MKTQLGIQSRRAGLIGNARSLKQAVAVLAAAIVIVVGTGTAHAFDVPTGGNPSPLFGATPFSQKMLMFEEFGTQPLPTNAPPHSLPDPQGCHGAVSYDTYNSPFDTFLSQPLYPAPQRTANTSLPNAWAATISACLGRPVTGVIEGRPPGEDFAHQRWDEFPPQVYFQTALGCSRVNGGIRDAMQLHGYSIGEFGPGGLYHNTVGPETAAKLGIPYSALNGTTKGIEIRFHPNMPVQGPEHLWTFDGTLPPKLLMAQYGKTILFRNHNALPIDASYNGGHGVNTISTHEHNGHNPAESDGFAGAFFFPGQYYDYRWPMVLAGHDSVPIGSTDPVLAEKNSKAGTPDGNGGITKIPGDWHETMSTHWFHDHMVDFTAQNVYKGNAVMMNYYSAIDRGREPASAAEAAGSADKPGYGCNYADPTDTNPNNVNLCLPSGSGLDWGNRDYDVNVVVADKAFDSTGQLWFNTFNTDGFVGDVMTVNFLYKPYFDVRARQYRFRILNGSVSRYMKIALVDEHGDQVPFHMIANDGNIMEHAVPFPNVQSPEGLPTQSIAERYDIIVDFSKFRAGDKLYLVNLLEHQSGIKPSRAVPLADVLSGAYAALCPAFCDPLVGKFLEIRVQSYSGVDRSMRPADYVEGKKKMIPLPGFTPTELANAKERTFSFNKGGDRKPWTIKTDGGTAYNATNEATPDILDRLTAAPEMGSVEIWHIVNGGGGWSHPVHIHFEEGQILQRGGLAPPLWEKGARKDVYRIGPEPDSTDSVDVAIRVREFLGTYVEHCHNTQHEDHAMLLRWDSQNPGQTVPVRTPYPTWDGVSYVATNTTDVPTYKTGALTNFLTVVAPPLVVNDAARTAMNTAVAIPVLANDTCVGGCTVALLTVPTHGTATAGPDGKVIYQPTAGYSGSDTFIYRAADTTVGQTSASAAVNIIVGDASEPPIPVPVNDTGATIQSTVAAVDVTANDANCSTVTPCTVKITSQPNSGTAIANSPSNGLVAYTPYGVFTGQDSFSYKATNSGGTSDTAGTVIMSVAPNPGTDIVTITGGNLQNGNLSVIGTVSVQNNAFAASVEIYAGVCPGTSLGTAPVGASGSWSFAANVAEPLDVVCVISLNGGIAQASVGGTASAPVFTSAPTLTAIQGKSYAYKVTAADVDGGPLTFSLDRAPAGMTVKPTSAYIAWIGWWPTDTQTGLQDVTVRATDPTGLFTTQSFRIDAAYVNGAPQPNSDAYTMIKGTTLNVPATGVLANDTDPDAGDTLTALKFTTPQVGTVNGNANGSFSYTPPPTYTGMVSFKYLAKDSHGLASKSAGFVSISVRANKAPVTVADTASTPLNTQQVINVLSNDSDPDTVIDSSNRIDPATVFIPAGKQPDKGGTVTFNADGTIRYTPASGFSGTETFMYAVRDNYSTPGISRAANVSVNVTGETITFNRAEYRPAQSRLRVDASIFPAAGQVVVLDYIGSAGEVLGTAGGVVTDGAGNLGLDTNVVLPAGTTTIRATSPNGVVQYRTLTLL